MMRSLRFRAGSSRVAGVLALVLWAAVAQADTAPLSATLTGEAKSSFEAGKLLLADNDYAGAATKFRAAYEASHDARLLWNMAACEKEMRHYARASVLVDRFLHDAPALVVPEQLAQARATQAALREFFSPVRIDVQPAGALVLVDGEEVGRAPFAAPVPIDLGRHVVRVEHEGFAPYETRVDVAGQRAVSIEVTLKPVEVTSVLAVSASEARDIVAVDGAVVASGRWEGPLAPGKHRVKVTADGKVAYVAEIDLARGEHRSVEVTLENEKKGGALWPWLVGGGAVLVAGASVGAYFLLKPSDTAGPPPTGKLGTVSINSVGFGGRL